MPKVNGRPAAASASAATPGDAEDVGDLVRVGGDSGRPVREHGTDELVHPQLGGLEVHVGVDEAGRERGAGDVDDLDGVAAAPAGDHPAGDGEVGEHPFPGAGDEDPAACEEEVRRGVPACHGEKVRCSATWRHQRSSPPCGDSAAGEPFSLMTSASLGE